MNRIMRDGIVFSGGLACGVIFCVSLATRSIVKSEEAKNAIKAICVRKIEKLLFREQKPCDDRFLFYECVNTEIGFDLDDIVFETKCDAEAVLGQLMDIADNYGYVSVADYLDLSGVAPEYFALTKRGWTWKILQMVKIVRGEDGHYFIKFPKPQTIPVQYDT